LHPTANPSFAEGVGFPKTFVPVPRRVRSKMKKAAQLQCWALGGLALALLAMAGWSQGPDKEAPIRLTVQVPEPNAMLYVDTYLTRQKGKERFFESPPVSTGKKHSYTLKVTWMEAGEEKTRTRKVRVEAGKENYIDLTKDDSKVITDKTDVKKTDEKTDKKKTDKKKADKAKTDLGTKDLVPPPDLPKKDAKKDTDTKKDTEAKKDDAKKDDAKKDDAKKDEGKDADVKKEATKKPNPDDKGASAPRAREFLFTYGARVTGLKPGQAARVWLPVPPSNEDQRVRRGPRELPFRV
jgi:uncharacterized protein (TIGR03000 family)